MPLTDTLLELMEIPAPTGQEEPVLAWCRERWEAAGATLTIAPIGNVLAHVPGDGPRLLVQGHADEIGFCRQIDRRSRFRLALRMAWPVAAPSPNAIRRPARAHRGPATHGFRAFSARRPVTILATSPERGKNTPRNDIFVDIGVDSKAGAETLGVHVGAGVIWNPPTRRLGTRIFGKAIDTYVCRWR